MIKTEFGIVENIESNKDYSNCEPDKYHCVLIEDSLYIDDWWDRLILMKTYFHSLNCTAYGLARHGVTLIPPESLPALQDIVISDKRISEDEHLIALADKIQEAINRQKYVIHFGV
jgi:hypothetical protein